MHHHLFYAVKNQPNKKSSEHKNNGMVWHFPFACAGFMFGIDMHVL
jgi:hypothetical protein